VHVLIIPDKLKGTLTAEAAAAAIARGWRKARPQDKLDLLPMSDGGDGFGAVLSRLLAAKAQTIKTVDAAHRPCFARWWWLPKTKIAIVEAATVIGLAMLPPKKFHPFDLDTFGLAAVLRAAAAKGARRCLIGIGGSATNDAGFGLARGLGWEFLDRRGHPIKHWTALRELNQIRPPKHPHSVVEQASRLPAGPLALEATESARTRATLPEACRRWFRELIVAVDVQNPLLGPRGATLIYGPQKGITSRDFAAAERSLRRLAHIAKKTFGTDFARHPGAGAAGGLGFGLLTFADGRLESGFDLFAHHARLERRLRSADLVITAEGAIDRSTLMGKGAGQIAARCRKLKIPCLALAGVIASHANPQHLFTEAHALTDLTSLAQAKATPGFWLERLAEQAARARAHQ
jgi:glycerate kinase